MLAIVCLVSALHLYLRRPVAYPKPNLVDWPGHGFDVRPIVGGVKNVKTDYLGALHSRPHPLRHDRAILARTRETVARAAYFRPEPDFVEEQPVG